MESVRAAVRSEALGDVLRRMTSEESQQEMLTIARSRSDQALDEDAKRSGVPDDQWPLHRAMVRGEPNAFKEEFDALDGLLRPGDIVLMTNPASTKLVKGQQRAIYGAARSSHVALAHAEFICIDAMPRVGVTNSTVSELLKASGDDWRVIRCDRLNDLDAVMKACAYYLAQPYRVLPSKLSAKSYAYCSELARKVYARCGVTDVGIPDDYVIAPAHFDKLADGVAGSPHWHDVSESVRPAIEFCRRYASLVKISAQFFIEGLLLNRKRYEQRSEWLKRIDKLERTGKISKEKADELRKAIHTGESQMNHTFWDARKPTAEAQASGVDAGSSEAASVQEQPTSTSGE